MVLILFDSGGTLVNDPFLAVLDDLSRTWNKDAVLPAYFNDISFPHFLTLWRTENAEIDFPFASHFLQEERWIISALQKLPPKYHLSQAIPTISPHILEMYRHRARLAIDAQAQLSVFRSVLKRLRHIGAICVASNDRDYAAQAMLHWARIDDLVDCVVTSEGLSQPDTIIEKPNPEFFRRAETEIARRLSVDSFDIRIYVGDNERNDIAVPNSLGYLTVRYFNNQNSPMNRWIDNTMTTSAAAAYRNPSELLGVIERLISFTR